MIGRLFGRKPNDDEGRSADRLITSRAAPPAVPQETRANDARIDAAVEAAVDTVSLSPIAQAMLKAIEANPNEVYLIEGHTDAVGDETDNLSLSDRRAEAVAIVLTEQFGVPPENLTTQGYGEQQLKVPTDGPERRNRRVTCRRITPLLNGPVAQRR